MRRNLPAYAVLLICCVILARQNGCTLPGWLPLPIVNVAPIKADGLHVLIVEESSQRNKLPTSQLAIFTSSDVRQTLESVKYRILDQDANLDNDEQVWREAMQIKRDSLPWLIVSNGKTGYSGPLPKTVKETTDLIQKYRG